MEKQQNAASHGNFLEHASLSLFNEEWSHAPLLQCLFIFFYFFEKSMKKV
jgi:hypothetical protein